MKRLILTSLMIVMLLRGGLVTATAQTDSSLEGFWLTEGYGMVIAITPEMVNVYEVTSKSCIPSIQLPNDSEALAATDFTFALENDQLVIRDGMTMQLVADRIEALPAVCDNGGTAETIDPEANFEVFWATFNEQYAFFDLYGVDWQAQYDTYRPQVTADTTSDELFAILCEMIKPLDDGHISLSSDSDEFSPSSLPEWLDLNDEALVDYIAEQYINGPTLTALAGGLISYKWLNDSVGYVSIFLMEGFGENSETELANAGAAMDQVVAEFADADTLIIDVRFNSGGFDATALTLAGRFADQERLAFTKQARNGDSFTPLREFYVQPLGDQQYNGNVVVLTSRLTASAAEIFVMAMQTLPNVTVIGEPTSGAHSDILGRTLPNGWEFGLSNEIYYASDGQVYESVGLQPDIAIPVNVENLLAGQDDMLIAAFAQSGVE